MKVVKVKGEEQVSCCLGFLERFGCCNLYLYEGISSGIGSYQNHCVVKGKEILCLLHTKTGVSLHLFFPTGLDDDTVFSLVCVLSRRIGKAGSIFGDRDCVMRLLSQEKRSVHSIREYVFMETEAKRFFPGSRLKTGSLHTVVPGKREAALLAPLQRAYETEEMRIDPSFLDTAKIQAALARRIGRGEITALYENRKPVAIAGVNAKYRDICQIGSIYVRLEKRGMGYGRELVSAHVSRLLWKYKKIVLFVDTKNQVACNLYKKLGFMERGILVQAEL
ncbi:MAG: GNAT family N-acetyltransferase [Spirochaetes bacterium]|nr:GNAT family N-acetyltransferase [Spirochaetota bacterium]